MTHSDITGCSKSNATPRYASPNSPLPQAKLEKIQECIEAANHLLRTLGNPREEENLTQLRLHFQTLRGALVKVDVDCKTDRLSLLGNLVMSGTDFIQLNAMGEQQFILFSRICSLQYQSNTKEKVPDQELIGIDPCLRKELVQRFGEVVASNPALLNIFLGIPLHLQLLSFVGCPISVKLEDGETIIQGVLVDSIENSIRISVGKECQDFNLNELCLITLKSGVQPNDADHIN